MEPVEELLVMAPCEGLKPAMPNHSQKDEALVKNADADDGD